MELKSLAHLSLKELQSSFRSGVLSPVEVTTASLEQIESVNEQLNALYGVRTEAALDEAKASEARYRAGTPISDFDGVPVTIKDSVNAVGMTWHHGSAIHGDGIVATRDAPPAARLKKAGAIILGKGCMPDFGLSGSGVSGSHGIVRNPWGMAWNTGGSSAGAGASLAAGIGFMSVGSDIAGSVRLPAAHCGLAALKPTQGVVPHAPASTVRSAGPITRSAAELDAWTRLLSGPDVDDRHSLPYSQLPPERPITVGATADFGFGPDVESAVLACFENARNILTDLVGEVHEIAKPADSDHYLPIDETLKIRGWNEYIGARPELRDKMPAQLLNWCAEAEGWGIAKFKEIDGGIERCVGYCVDLMDGLDFLLTPVMPVVNFPAEDRGIDPLMPLRHSTFTAPFNQSGHPAVSICGGFDERGLPIGIQLVAHRLDDARLLQLAARLEAALNIYGPGGKQWPVVPIG